MTRTAISDISTFQLWVWASVNRKEQSFAPQTLKLHAYDSEIVGVIGTEGLQLSRICPSRLLWGSARGGCVRSDGWSSRSSACKSWVRLLLVCPDPELYSSATAGDGSKSTIERPDRTSQPARAARRVYPGTVKQRHEPCLQQMDTRPTLDSRHEAMAGRRVHLWDECRPEIPMFSTDHLTT